MEKSFKIFFIFAFLPLQLLLSCSKNNNEYEELLDKQFPKDLHVFFIGFNGWGGHSFLHAKMPVVEDLMNRGAYTLKKRSVSPSASAINWASLYMAVPPEIHGYLNWDSKTPEIEYDFPIKNNIFPTIFQILKEQRPECISSLFYSWEGIKYLVDTLSIDNIIRVPYNGDIEQENLLNRKLKEHILSVKPAFLNVYYCEPDEIGHQNGFQSEEYYAKLQVLDSYIGNIMQYTKDAGIFQRTIFIITSDHGGLGNQHGGYSLEEMETPLIIYGPNVKNGEIKKMIMQYDIGATIAWLFNLKTPSIWVGNPIREAFD